IISGVASFALYANRLPLLTAEARLESMVSREASFLFNNLVFIVIAFAVLWGTLLPILSEAVVGVKYTVLAPWFNPVILTLGRARHRQYGEGYALALGRLIARNRRRYGGYIVHTGMVMLFVAFAGMAFKTETEASLRPGESASIKSPYGWTYRLTHLGISQYDALNRQVTAATLEVSRDGKRLGVLTTEKRQHVDALGRPTFQPST